MRIRSRLPNNAFFPYAGISSRGVEIIAGGCSPDISYVKLSIPTHQRQWSNGQIEIYLNEAERTRYGALYTLTETTGAAIGCTGSAASLKYYLAHRPVAAARCPVAPKQETVVTSVPAAKAQLLPKEKVEARREAKSKEMNDLLSSPIDSMPEVPKRPLAQAISVATVAKEPEAVAEPNVPEAAEPVAEESAAGETPKKGKKGRKAKQAVAEEQSNG